MELIDTIDAWFCKKDKMTLKDYHNIKTSVKWFEEESTSAKKVSMVWTRCIIWAGASMIGRIETMFCPVSAKRRVRRRELTVDMSKRGLDKVAVQS